MYIYLNHFFTSFCFVFCWVCVVTALLACQSNSFSKLSLTIYKMALYGMYVACVVYEFEPRKHFQCMRAFR